MESASYKIIGRGGLQRPKRKGLWTLTKEDNDGLKITLRSAGDNSRPNPVILIGQ